MAMARGTCSATVISLRTWSIREAGGVHGPVSLGWGSMHQGRRGRGSGRVRPRARGRAEGWCRSDAERRIPPALTWPRRARTRRRPWRGRGLVPANQPGAEFVGAAAVLADMELEIDRRRPGGVADAVEELGDRGARALDRAVFPRAFGIAEDGDPEDAMAARAGEVGDPPEGADKAAAQQDVAQIRPEAAESISAGDTGLGAFIVCCMDASRDARTDFGVTSRQIAVCIRPFDAGPGPLA